MDFNTGDYVIYTDIWNPPHRTFKATILEVIENTGFPYKIRMENGDIRSVGGSVLSLDVEKNRKRKITNILNDDM